VKEAARGIITSDGVLRFSADIDDELAQMLIALHVHGALPTATTAQASWENDVEDDKALESLSYLQA
jgi:hypothetical protein